MNEKNELTLRVTELEVHIPSIKLLKKEETPRSHELYNRR